MQNNIIRRISPTVRIICLFILIISLFLARSIFLIFFITTLTLILLIITGKKVNLYVNIIKKVVILLLFLLSLYIIMFKYDVFNCLIFAYKLIIITMLFAVFYFNTNLNQLYQSIYECLKPLEKMKINVEGVSFNIVLSLIFLKSLINNERKIRMNQKLYGKMRLNFKNYILSIFINSATEINEYQYCLKRKVYKLSTKKSNLFSKFILIVFVILFILIVFKEVIL